jgi:hypothetical protein
VRPAEIGKVDDEGGLRDVTTRGTQQLCRGERSAAGRDQVVDDQDARAGPDRVGMDLDPREVAQQICTVR